MKFKIARIIGLIALAAAIALIITGIVGSTFRNEGSRLNSVYVDALNHSARNQAHADSAAKAAPSAVKKAETAVKQADTAFKDTEEALNNAKALYEGYLARSSGDELIKMLFEAADAIKENSDVIEAGLDTEAAFEPSNFKAALAELRSAGLNIEDAAYDLTYALFEDEFSAALKSLTNAEAKVITAVSGIQDVYKKSDLPWAHEEITKTEADVPAEIDLFVPAIEALFSRAQYIKETADALMPAANQALADASSVTTGDLLTTSERLLLMIGKAHIFVTLTGIILAAAGLIAVFIPRKFAYAWKHVPVFSVFITAIVMIIILTYAHGNTLNFEFKSYADWGSKWLLNFLNVLRSNASIGMVALGMTFVIITGGIDLAVGSTLAGVATVVMVVLDVSQSGFFVNNGLVGMPNYLVAIGMGLAVGLILGALTGVGVTKGRIPPFIVTLGIMNIVRSVAQYFTKSTKIEVPTSFQPLANMTLKQIVEGIVHIFNKDATVSFGGGFQFMEDVMLLPIIYWLILVVIMYVISKHTAFGRHIYAVGSNERTSRLSGINVDRVKIAVYMLMGLIVSIAAITQVARLRGVDVASAGSGLEMSAIAAVVVGGTSMAGGRGSIIGTVLGVLIIGIMDNLVVLLHIDAFLSNAFIGAIIIFAVLMQRKDK